MANLPYRAGYEYADEAGITQDDVEDFATEAQAMAWLKDHACGRPVHLAVADESNSRGWRILLDTVTLD